MSTNKVQCLKYYVSCEITITGGCVHNMLLLIFGLNNDKMYIHSFNVFCARRFNKINNCLIPILKIYLAPWQKMF